jgi:hypothetical protein
VKQRKSRATGAEESGPDQTVSPEKRIRDVLERVRHEPEARSGWVMRKERTSPLETTYVAP